MIPLNALLTPYQSPTPIANFGQGLGDAGEFMELQRRNRAQEAQQALTGDRNYELQREETAGKNRYYDSQAAYRQDALNEKAAAAKEKRVSKLMDSLAKAHRSGDTVAIQGVLQELQRAGYQVSEEDTALPEEPVEVAAATIAQGPKLGTKSKGPGGGSLPVSSAVNKVLKKGIHPPEMLGWERRFQSQLNGYMNDQSAPPAASEVTTLTPEQEVAFQKWAKANGVTDVDKPGSFYDYRGAFLDGLKPGTDRHWPDTYKQHGHPTFSVESKYSKDEQDGGQWDGDRYVPGRSAEPTGLGAAPPELGGPLPQQAGAQGIPKAKRGGRYVVKDPATGETVHEFDAPVVAEQQRSQVLAVMKPFIGEASTPQEKKAAQVAADAAAKTIGILPPEKTVEFFQKAYQAEMSRYKKTVGDAGAGGVAGGGAPGLPSKTELRMDSMANEETHRIIQRVGGQYNMKAATDAENYATQGLAHLRAASEGGMQQLAGLKEYLLQMSGKTVTDAEMGQLLDSTGKLTAMQGQLNRYVDEGRMPPEFARQLEGVLVTGQANARRRRNEAGQVAYEEAVRATGDERQADIARGHFTGKFSTPAQGKRVPSAPSKAAAPSAPAAPSDARKRAEEWLKKNGG